MKRHVVPGLLVACTLVLAFWIVASQHTARPFKPFNLTHADFAGYCPALEGAVIQPAVMTAVDPAEPNIAAFGVMREGGRDPGRIVVRLVHGYNMPMCMKIKGYTVEPVGGEKARSPNNSTTQQLDNPSFQGIPIQLWRVTSSAGDVELWATTMIRSENFSVTPEEVTSMAFPRVDIPDDPNWVPRGFTAEDLKHPVKSVRLWLRARWNASRTDLLTFLRLRQPAWASDELLTYVSHSLPPSVSPEREPLVIRQMVSTHIAMLKELQKWRRTPRTP